MKVIQLKKDRAWWKEEREPSTQAFITKPKKLPTKFFTVKEVSDRLSISVSTVYEFISCGELECQRMGRMKRISLEALELFLFTQNRKQG